MFDKLITSVSGRIVEYAFTDNTSDNDEREICSYGIEILISSIIGVLIILLIGSFIGMLYETVLYLTVFISLRHYTGGLHLNTYTKCNISSSLLFVMIMSLYKFIENNYKIYPLLVCVFLSVAVVIIHCPVENINKPVSEEERKKLKIKAVILSIGYGIIGIILAILGYKCGALIIYIITEVILLAVAAILMKRRQEHEKHQR